MSIHPVHALVRSRRSVFPKFFTEEPVSRETIEKLLETANWAPTHRMTEPWRFRIFRGKALERLGDYLASWYKDNTPEESFSLTKWEKNRQKPRRSSAVIIVSMQRDEKERVPEWEELAATACAVENFWIAATAEGLGTYWSTPRAILEANEFLELAPGERCLGMLYLGHHQMPDAPRNRGSIQDKIRWIDS